MKKVLSYGLGGLAVVLVLYVAGFYAWTRVSEAAPGPVALAALEGDAVVSVEDATFVTFRPGGSAPETGLIVYPGANCDVRGYAPAMREIAARGYLVVGVPMPLNLSIFAPDRADKVRAAYPEVQRWVIAGHSMGGAMAASYAFKRPEELAGLIIWDAHPAESNSLVNLRYPVWHIHRATADGAPPEKFAGFRNLFPADSVWAPLPGGNHMQFGDFIGGRYEEQWEPTLSLGEQQDLLVEATLAALAAMAGPTAPD